MSEAIVFWSIVIIISGVVELQTAQITSIWFTIAGIISLILSFFEIIIEIQIVVFFVVSIGLLLSTRPIVKKYVVKNIVKTNTDKLITMVGIVTKPILAGEIGEVRVNQEFWRAISPSAINLEVGDYVVVNAITGNKLLVSKINQQAKIDII